MFKKTIIDIHEDKTILIERKSVNLCTMSHKFNKTGLRNLLICLHAYINSFDHLRFYIYVYS